MNPTLPKTSRRLTAQDLAELSTDAEPHLGEKLDDGALDAARAFVWNGIGWLVVMLVIALVFGAKP